MTIDDDNSIYVGGLPYESSEEAIRRVFDLYGAVVAVKIINDREVGGKCYGFVTFTNPRSAIDAINDMNGRTIGGRVVRVNEVRTRGGRPNFNRDTFHHDIEKDMEWDRDRDRERDNDRDRDRWDRNNSRSRDRDREREREYEHGRDHDRTRERVLDRDRSREDHAPERNWNHDRDRGRDRELDLDRDREMDKIKDHERIRDKNKDYQSKNRLGPDDYIDRRSREMSSNSSDEYHEQVKEQLDLSLHRHEELQNEIARIEDMSEEKQQLVSDLQKKAQKLEDALASAKKLTSHRQTQLTKLQRCFMQVKDHNEKLKSSEQELQLLIDTAMVEADGEDIDIMDAPLYINSKA
eukprot:TRINITY_DN6837_c0_g1_i1.p1 TRINITY_DN6837_c0_g1~~TRINITY_DN6837_c0_g1_i1.p1  ORF type:complete len:351 (+),score=63.64 TRINITY_DN6837_c0_g1_i1:116-1168(+)